MRFVITGSSGLIGTALARSLESGGHEVARLVRRPPRAPGELEWDSAGPARPALVDGADVVVNLAGAGLDAHRWTPAYQDIMLRSRTGAAAAVAAMAARAQSPPGVLISASGMRYYGVDRGDEVLTEASAPASPGFLPGIVREWEAATEEASRAGVRVCHLRLGLVLSPDGGILARLLPLFRAGLGARFGTGREFWSYISLPDTIRAIRFLVTLPGASGPYNLTAPQPVRNEEFTRALARAVGRPALLRLPKWAIRLPVGGPATEVLGSLRVIPARLADAGFRHEHPDVHAALRDSLLRPPSGRPARPGNRRLSS